MSATPVQTHALSTASRGPWIARHPVAAFFALAYAFSWLITLPLLLGTNGLGLFAYTVPAGVVNPLIIIQSFGPAVAGLVMATLTGSGARHLLKQYLRLRVGLVAYLGALVGPPLMVLLGATVVRGAGVWQALAQEGLLLLPYFLLYLVILFFAGGPLGEEVGWRGFALPRLQARHGALLASLIVAVGWVLWHLPLFFIPESGTWTGNLAVYTGSAVALSIIHTWMYNRAQASLFVVTLLHAAVDASTRYLLPLIFGTDRAAGNLVPVIGFGVGALLLIGLTRGRLTYQPGRDATPVQAT